MFRKDPFITGEYYHLYNRGVDKRTIFQSHKDYERFMMLLYISNSALERPFRLDDLINDQNKIFDEILVLERGDTLVSIGAWCLMPNHFHILVRQNVDEGITKFMRKLGVGYSMYFNIKYERQGALFGGPFKSKCIKTDDNYLRHLFAYIHLNPLDLKFPKWSESTDSPQELFLRSGHEQKDMKKFLEEYPYFSYPEYIGIKRTEESILHRDTFPNYFQSTQSFKDFVENYLSTQIP